MSIEDVQSMVSKFRAWLPCSMEFSRGLNFECIFVCIVEAGRINERVLRRRTDRTGATFQRSSPLAANYFRIRVPPAT